MIKPHYLITILFVLLFISACEQQGEFVKPSDIHWEYENPDWQMEGYGDCAGKVQSPIDIDTGKTIKATLSNIDFAYKPFNMKIVDNGHTIQINTNGDPISISLNGQKFVFKQFHFHHHSEHHINGHEGDMELHLVHVDEATGNITVLGIMLKEGAVNNAIAKIWDVIPTTKKKEVTTSVELDLLELLPANKDYFTYTGSLTTPPCSQGLQWILFKQPVELSAEQIHAFGSIYEDNARPIQPVNNRPVLEKI